jgi:acetoacetyl-CoA reductase/3-oxoacyl-[acyl-carrier protein] reductase
MMVIITGASKGIGKYLFQRMTEEDIFVVGTYNSTNCGRQPNMYKVDIADYNSVQLFYQLVSDSAKNVILINCAGVSYSAFTHKSDPDAWKKVIEINLIGSYNMIRVFLPMMREQQYGRIINFSSVVTMFPTPGVSAYAASKSALIGLSKTLAAENGSKGISTNVINLGYVNIGMGENDVPAAYREWIMTQIPKGRFCFPEEVYNTVNYIINTDYLNGSIIDLNGGLV